MTIMEAITSCEERRAGLATDEEKLRWLSQLDGRIYCEVSGARVGRAEMPVYGADTDPTTELLVGAPYDALYPTYLEAQIDLACGEIARYNNASAVVTALLDAYAAHRHRSHLAAPRALRYF